MLDLNSGLVTMEGVSSRCRTSRRFEILAVSGGRKATADYRHCLARRQEVGQRTLACFPRSTSSPYSIYGPLKVSSREKRRLQHQILSMAEPAAVREFQTSLYI